MKRKLLGIAAALMSVALLMGGCATLLLPGTTSDTASASATVSEDASTIIVAEVNGVAIYKDAYNSLYNELLTGYYNGQYDLTDEALNNFDLYVLDQLIINEVCNQKFAEMGYDELSEEDMAQAEADMMDYLVSYVEYYYWDDVIADLEEGYTDEELRAAAEAYAADLLEQEDEATQEALLENFTYPIMYDNAYEAEVGDVEPVEQEIKDRYNEYVEADQETIASSPTTYVTQVNLGATVYYVPEGVRRVRQVLIPMDEEMVSAIGVLRDSDYDAAADILQREGLLLIEEQANEALGKLESGTTFDELIEEYNPDADMPEEGYAVMEGATDNSEAYVTAALELVAIGDHTGLVATDDGYYILEYYADEPDGPIAYDKVRDGIADEIRTTLQDEAWDEVVDQWKSEASIQTYEGNL